MCGIAGILRFNPPHTRREEIEAMTAAISRRGPDDQGLLCREGLALGHRRLSIIDLEGGRQPLCNETQQIWIVFNGEIYNYKQLREQLVELGHQFKTHSDTEVIVHAYEQWGKDCVTHFRGMFAFAITDYDKREIFLARDHMGIKPLHYRTGQNYFAWASELNALQMVHDNRSKLNHATLGQYLSMGYFIAPDTVYTDVRTLQPAHYMVVDFLGNFRTPPTRYWQMTFESNDSLSETQWLEQLEHVILDSVKAHMVSDVPFGVFLSGGLDSTLIAVCMSQLMSQPVKAFSIGFKEEAFSEEQYAVQAAKQIGVEHHMHILDADIHEVFADLVGHYGQPYADGSMIPTWHVCKLAREHVPMVLSGDGSDEFFGGYMRYHYWLLYQQLIMPAMRFRIRSFKQTLREMALTLSVMFNPVRRQAARWEKLMSIVPPYAQPDLWKPEYQQYARMHSQTYMQTWQDNRHMNLASQAQFNDIQTYLPDDILTKVDMASMWHGLEVRTPLIDIKVAEFASRIPVRFRCHRIGMLRFDQKYLIKKILGKQFDQAFVSRPKMGFGIPETAWLGKGKPLRKYVDSILLDPRSRIASLMQTSTMHKYVSCLDEGQSHNRVVWTLLCLGLWLELNPEVIG